MTEAGKSEDAVALLQGAFERQPTIGLYRQLNAIGGEPGRVWALARLKARIGEVGGQRAIWDSAGSLLVQILTEEGSFDQAWSVVRRGAASIGAAEALARASEATHPQEAIAFYAAEVDRFAATGGNTAYQRAAERVRHIGALQDAAAQAAYVADLKARFERKRNFMKLLG